MSVWAQSWAYEQRTGSGGAKAVLVALAVFADENGYCYPSQERIAGMTEQAVRTVRLHLASLEEVGFIRRERRRRADGTYTSDGFHLVAPAERLRPHIPAPEEPLRQILPAADIADGKKEPNQRQKTAQPAAKNCNDQRQILPGNSQGINRQVKPSVEPSERESRRANGNGRVNGSAPPHLVAIPQPWEWARDFDEWIRDHKMSSAWVIAHTEVFIDHYLSIEDTTPERKSLEGWQAAWRKWLLKDLNAEHRMANKR